MENSKECRVDLLDELCPGFWERKCDIRFDEDVDTAMRVVAILVDAIGLDTIVFGAGRNPKNESIRELLSSSQWNCLCASRSRVGRVSARDGNQSRYAWKHLSAWKFMRRYSQMVKDGKFDFYLFE